VLSEEAFVLVLGLVATGLVVLGTLEALLPRHLWSRRARPPVRPTAPGGREPGGAAVSSREHAGRSIHPRRTPEAVPEAAREQAADRRWDENALADPPGPPETAAALRPMTLAPGGEVGQLTAEAIRRLQEGREDEALGILDRAGAVLATIPDDGISAERRQELERRLWWGFTRLGLKRVEAGRLEEAVEPLMRALAFQSVGPDRRHETRGPLARALQGVVEAQAAEAERLLRAGDREGVRRLAERSRALLAAAAERGLTRDELAGALEAVEELLERLSRVAP
jgi:hypothetical protein